MKLSFSKIWIFVIVILLALVGGVFLRQKTQENSLLQEQREVLEKNIAQLVSKQDSLQIVNSKLQKEREIRVASIESVRAQKEEFESLISRMTGSTKESPSSFPEKERSIQLLAPNGGENLCLDEEFEIRWESFNIQRIQITLKRGGFAYRVAEYYPAAGSYLWKVGRLVSGRIVEPGEGYSFTITSYDGGFGLFDESDGSFFITRCEG